MASEQKTTKKKVKRKAKVKRRKKAHKVLVEASPAKRAKPRREPVPITTGVLPTQETVSEAKTYLARATDKSRFIPPLPEVNKRNNLRWAAGVFYTTSTAAISIESMSGLPEFESVTVQTMQKWGREDGWVARREENLEKWHRAIENSICTELVKARQKDLNDLRDIYTDMIAKLKDETLRPRSYEGMVSALVKVATLTDEWSVRMLHDIMPAVSSAPLDDASVTTLPMATAKPALTSEEARAAAKVIMEQRRQERALRQAAQSQDDDKRPKLEVVKGESSG